MASKKNPAEQAAEDMIKAHDNLRKAANAWVIDPSEENEQAHDAAWKAADEATAESRRLHGGSK